MIVVSQKSILFSLLFLGATMTQTTVSPTVLELTKENIHTIATLSQEKPLIIDLYMDGCPPCKLMKPIFEQLAEELSSTCTFARLNGPEVPEVAQAYGIAVFPTFVVIKDGKLVGKCVGGMSAEAFKERITEILTCGNDLSKLNSEQRTARLREAMIARQPADMHALIEAGVDVNAPFVDGITPITLAVFLQCNPEIIKILLDAGAKAEARMPGRTQSLKELVENSQKGCEAILENYKKTLELLERNTTEQDKKVCCSETSCMVQNKR